MSGEAFVLPRYDTNPTHKLQQAQHLLEDADWRISEIVIMPVASLQPRPD